MLDVIENNAIYINTLPKCEPQLGKRGLYGAIGGDKDAAAANMAMLWILNLSDGQHSLLDIAERGGSFIFGYSEDRRASAGAWASGISRWIPMSAEPHALD